MKRIGAVMGASALTTALFLAVPTTAQAATYTQKCGTGRVASLANNLPLYVDISINSESWDNRYSKGDQFNCEKGGLYVGGRYTACGVTNGNGWIKILFRDGITMFTYQACLKDV